jgi:hypothetical protein
MGGWKMIGRLVCVVAGLPVAALAGGWVMFIMFIPPVTAAVTAVGLLPVEVLFRLTGRLVERTRWALPAILPAAAALFTSAAIFAFYGVLGIPELKHRTAWEWVTRLTRETAEVVERLTPLIAGIASVIAIGTAVVLARTARNRPAPRVTTLLEG